MAVEGLTTVVARWGLGVAEPVAVLAGVTVSRPGYQVLMMS